MAKEETRIAALNLRGYNKGSRGQTAFDKMERIHSKGVKDQGRHKGFGVFGRGERGYIRTKRECARGTRIKKHSRTNFLL